MSLYSIALGLGAFLILITMYARLNDLCPDKNRSPIWWVRRASFLLVIAACAMIMAAPVSRSVAHWDALTKLAFEWGVFGVFFTSPNQKPWWQLIAGEHRADGTTLTGEIRALIAGFRGRLHPIPEDGRYDRHD